MKSFVAALVALLLISCANKPETADPTPGASDSSASRPADSVAQPLPPAPGPASDTPAIVAPPAGSGLRLLDTGLPFTTFYPENELILQQNSSDEGIGLRFVGNFGGRKNDSIYIHFFFPSGAASLAEMNEYVTGENGAMAAAGWSRTGPATMSCPWANISYLYADTRQPGTGGAICIGQHRGGAFYMITHYPDAYAGEVESHLARIFSQLRWKDTGSDLRKE